MMKENRNILEAIRNHPLFQEYYGKLENAEKGRKFCCHQMDHLLDVARIAYIENLEQGLGIRREVIYAAALLHDIGKYRQYAEQIPHEIASAEIAEIILRETSGEISKEMLNEMADEISDEMADEMLKGMMFEKRSGFTKEEQHDILGAILGHRKYREDMTVLEKLLYTADKKSRQCFVCPAEKECNWSTEKKNMELTI